MPQILKEFCEYNNFCFQTRVYVNANLSLIIMKSTEWTFLSNTNELFATLFFLNVRGWIVNSRNSFYESFQWKVHVLLRLI